jgi:hypothetical protein
MKWYTIAESLRNTGLLDDNYEFSYSTPYIRQNVLNFVRILLSGYLRKLTGKGTLGTESTL